MQLVHKRVFISLLSLPSGILELSDFIALGHIQWGNRILDFYIFFNPLMMQYIRRQKQKEEMNKIYLDGQSENSVDTFTVIYVSTCWNAKFPRD